MCKIIDASVLLMALFGCSLSWACPMFVEFFPDPVDVSDQEGEFVEIRLDSGGLDSFDSLFVQFEEKAALRIAPSKGVSRMVFVHDSAYCPRNASVGCGLLGSLSLPNSRETYWRSWVLDKGGSVSCLDSVGLPVPKAGKSLQRVRETDRWEFTFPTLGEANPDYELGIEDCGLDPLRTERLGDSNDVHWKIRFSLGGCDSSWIAYDILNLFNGKKKSRSMPFKESLDVDDADGGAVSVHAALPSDDVSINNRLDTILFAPGHSPLVVSEVHHCPQEPEPEWVEVYNRTSEPLPLQKFHFCGRGGVWGRNEYDSIAPFQSVIFTKDSAGLLEVLGYRDFRIIQISMGYLNNASGNISICYGDVLVDSVSWDKSTVACPLGFNPLSGKAEYTPGYLGTAAKKDIPFTYKISSRVVTRDGNPLRVFVEGESSVLMKLLDSAGRTLWKFNVPAGTSTWWSIPLDGLPRTGVAYVSLSSGMFEKRIGFVIRP